MGAEGELSLTVGSAKASSHRRLALATSIPGSGTGVGVGGGGDAGVGVGASVDVGFGEGVGFKVRFDTGIWVGSPAVGVAKTSTVICVAWVSLLPWEGPQAIKTTLKNINVQNVIHFLFIAFLLVSVRAPRGTSGLEKTAYMPVF
jgi:hypothetical protein